MINGRVGIHGWSYGGYLSLMGLVQYPAEFKVIKISTTNIYSAKVHLCLCVIIIHLIIVITITIIIIIIVYTFLIIINHNHNRWLWLVLQ